MHKTNVQTHHRPSTPAGQHGALVAASKRCKIASSAFIMEIENPDNKKPKEVNNYIVQKIDCYLHHHQFQTCHIKRSHK